MDDQLTDSERMNLGGLASEGSYARAHKSTLQLFVAGLTAQVLVASTYILAARNGNPAEYGAVVAVSAAATVIGGVLDWGSGANALRQLAAGRLAPTDFQAWWRGRAVIFGCVAGLFGIVAVLVVQVVPVVAVGSAVMLAAQPVAFAASAPLRVATRFGLIALVTSLTRVLGLCLMVLAVSFSPKPYLFLPLILGCSMAVEVVVYGVAVNALSRQQPVFTWRVWKGSTVIGFSSSVLALQGLDVNVVARFGGLAAAGDYGAVNRWTSPMGLLSSAFTQAITPKLAAAQSHREALVALRSGLKWLGLTALTVALVVVFAKPLTLLLLGEQYAGTAATLRVLAVGTAFAVVNQPLFSYLLSRNRDLEAAGVAGTIVALQLGLTALFASSSGAFGAACAYLVAQASATVGLALLVRHSVKCV